MTNINFIEFKPSKYNMKYMKGLYKLCNEVIPDYAIELYNENLFDEDLIEKYNLSFRDIELLNYMIAYKQNIVVLGIKIPHNVNMAYIDHKLQISDDYKNVLVTPDDTDYIIDNSVLVSDMDHVGDETIGLYRYGIDAANIIPIITSSGMNIDMSFYTNGPIDIPSTIKQLYYKRYVVFSSTSFYNKPFSPIMHKMYSSLLPYNFYAREGQFLHSLDKFGMDISKEYDNNSNKDPDHLLGMGIFIY